MVIAGPIEYAFVGNDVTGGTPAILTLSLVLVAVHVPMMIGFTVARYGWRNPPSRDINPSFGGLRRT